MAHHQADQKIDIDKKMLVDVMKRVDICMMTTVATTGSLHSRPMSNNKDVEWDGDTWFFAYADSSQVQEIVHNPNVNLGYSRPDYIIFVSLTGSGTIVIYIAIIK
jgi:general stress protein 26